MFTHVKPVETIRQCIRFSYTSALNKCTHKVAKQYNALVTVDEMQVTWYARAFGLVPKSY